MILKGRIVTALVALIFGIAASPLGSAEIR